MADRFDFEHPVERGVGLVAEVDQAQHLEARDSEVDGFADLDLHGVGGVSEVAAVGEVDAVAEHEGEPIEQVYTYAWRNNPRRAELFGRRCVIEVAGGSMGTALLRFLDTGERVSTSRRALRKTGTAPAASAASRRVPCSRGQLL